MGWGDEIIVTGVARRLQARGGPPVRVLDGRGRSRWHPIWDHNARLARPDWRGAVQTTTNAPGRRPYIEREARERWIWRDWVCPVGEIALTENELAFGARRGHRIILEPNVGTKASPNKDWGWARYFFRNPCRSRARAGRLRATTARTWSSGTLGS